MSASLDIHGIMPSQRGIGYRHLAVEDFEKGVYHLRAHGPNGFFREHVMATRAIPRWQFI